MIRIEQFIFNAFQERCCILWDESGRCAIVDPGCKDAEKDRLVAFITSGNLTPECILLTHGHFDHIYGAAELSKGYGIPIYMDEKEKYSFDHTNPYVCGNYALPMPELPPEEAFRYVKEGDTVQIGSIRLEVLQTPGHSVGGLCYLDREGKVLFSGDTLFAGAIGRTDHPGGDYDELMKSIFTKLLHLDGDTKVIPGHGPCTDIATERMTNPFLLPFNEPYEE